MPFSRQITNHGEISLPPQRQKTHDKLRGHIEKGVGKTFSEVMKTLMKNSSVPAVSNIGMSKSLVGKFLWFIIFLILAFACAFQVLKFMEKYFMCPVVISLTEERMETLGFPSVTLCNLNRMINRYEDCLLYNITDARICDNSLARNGPVEGTLYASSLYAYKGPRIVISKEKIHPNKNATEEQKFLYSYFHTPENIRMDMSHQETFVQKCTFAGHNCQLRSQARFFFHYRYGFCMTFNIPQGKKKVILKTNKAGSEGGLELKLNIEYLRYLPYTHSIGGRIVIHHTSERPDLEEQGFNIGPGQTSITLSQTITKRLPPPYKDSCFNYSEGVGTGLRSQRECLKLCIQQNNFKTCGCIDSSTVIFKGFPVCDLWNDQQLKCLNKSRGMARHCNCPRACHSIHYNEHTSRAGYPSFTSQLRELLSESDMYAMDIDWAKEMWQGDKDSYVKLNVYYSTLNRKTFQQFPAFHDSEVLGNLGGAFVFWVGISLFFIFELLEIMITFMEYTAILPLKIK